MRLTSWLSRFCRSQSFSRQRRGRFSSAEPNQASHRIPDFLPVRSTELLEDRTLLTALQVDTLGDVVDGNVTSFAALGMNPGPDGMISLRETVLASNSDGGGHAVTIDPILDFSTIMLQLNGAGEDAGATGDLDVRESLTITGNGTTLTLIDGGRLDRVFHVHSGATLTLENLSVQGGSSDLGGGIKVEAGSGTINLIDVMVQNNVALDGGGIFSEGAASIERSTLRGNQATADGGGIDNRGQLFVANSTISGNQAANNGGGVFQHVDSPGAVFVNTTITDNTADSDTNESGDGGGLFSQSGAATPQLRNTIIAGNHDFSTGTIHRDASGGTSGNSNNLVGNRAGISGTLGTLSDVDLSALGLTADDVINRFPDFNGGRTLNHALVRTTTNPAINAGNNSNAVDAVGSPLATDQRGGSNARIVDGTVDIGSFELGLFVERDSFFNTIDQVTIENPTGQTETVILTGSIGFEVFFESPFEGDANDDDGNGRDEVQTEIVQLNLSGTTGDGTPLTVTLNPAMRSLGEIEELANNNSGLLDVDPFATGTANSFFDVFFQVDVGGTLMFNDGTANRWQSVISRKPAGPDEPYVNSARQPLFDDQGNPTGFFLINEIHNTNPEQRDFGTADDPPFPTTIGSNGARHILGSGLFLGSGVTAEGNGPSFDQNDGVSFVDLIQPGQTVELDVTASAGGGVLNAWLDYNGDGDWDDSGEQIFTNVALAAGENTLTLDVPAAIEVTCDQVWSRFRLSTQRDLTPIGDAPDGEVEDYSLRLRTNGLLTESLDGPLTAADLATDLVGTGITVSGVTFTGANTAAGRFTDNGGVTGLSSGIILSSGHIQDVAGPNCLDDITTDHQGPGDSDLDILADFNGQDFDTFDASVLKFDFVPDNNAVTFNYVFSSDEYNEFVNTAFNDVFAFFVNGTNRATVAVQKPATLDVRPNGTDNDIRISARQPGAGGNNITVEFVVPAANDSALSSSVNGNAITITLGTDGSGNPNSTAAAVIGELESTGLLNAEGLRDPDGDFNNGDGLVGPLAATVLSGGGPAGDGPVAINTINNGNPLGSIPNSNPALFRNNDLDDGGGSIDTEMDGLTVVLTFAAEVNRGQTNSIKIAIADTSDSILDSNVMIEAGSFSSTDLDFGDAPDSYKTLLGSDGARHAIVDGFFLGNPQSGGDVDGDTNGEPSPGADGDDLVDGNDDEDGVVFTTALEAGEVAGVDVTASADGFLDAWVDFNGDGMFDPIAELIFAMEPLAAGLTSLRFIVPGDADGGTSYARFRFSGTGGLLPFGLAPDGEVEDYEVSITGATIPGSIHGYKFEDLNVDGIDNDTTGDGVGDEPRLAGVTITLTGDVDGDGQTDTITQVTNANGEYWFEDLEPGPYTVAEAPPFGSFPTTPVSFDVTVESGQELVALEGQAHLQPGDPETEIVIGPELAFGNAFEGSIHGFKFEDINGDGIRQPGEPPMEGVRIDIEWEDGQGQTQTDHTRTDDDGEYWFTWLTPGLTYIVTETPPPGSVQTTPDPQPITIHSGEEYVINPEQGRDVQNIVHFPLQVDVNITPVATGTPETIVLTGTAAIEFEDPVGVGDPLATFDIVDRVHGLPLDVPAGETWRIDTELVELSLTGVDSGGRNVFVTLQPGTETLGQVVTEVDPGSDFLVGDSFFDVFFEVTYTDPADGSRLLVVPVGGDAPVRVGMTFTPQDEIPRDDVRWMPAIFWSMNLNTPLVDDQDVTHQTLNDIHSDPLVEVEKPVRPVIEPLLEFGNTFPGSIHGYKYEDLNVNGIDDDAGTDGIGDEPRLAGVEITLIGDADGDGQTDTLTQFTDANGEYWFENLYPGVYSVSELPSFGLFPTTPTEYVVTVDSRLELVAVPGQAHLPDLTTFPDGDPRVEVVVGPELAFGNAFEGSIHGFKFEDLNGDGIRQPDEPPLEGVRIDIEWEDGQGQTQTDHTRTDDDGEYWFTWLTPGLTYTVTETPPAGSVQTTPDPVPITILSGQEYVATPEQGRAAQLMYSFPWWWEVTIDPVTTPPGQTETLMLEGMVTIQTSEYLDPTTRDVIAPLADQDGLPLAPPVGQQATVETEIVELSLVSPEPIDIGGTLFDVSLHPQPGTEQLGQINVQHRTDLGPGGDQPGLVGDSFFDVFTELTFVDLQNPAATPMVIRPEGPGPIRVGMPFDDNNPPPTPTIIPPDDVRWMPAFFWAQGIGRDLIDDAGNVWDELISIHAIPHSEREKPVRPVIHPDLEFGNSYLGSIHGHKFHDLNGDGVEDAGEPGLPGVTIRLTGDADGDGQTDVLSLETNDDGEYWFENLYPGSYTVSEVPPPGSIPTTPTSNTVTVLSRQELVAEDGQAHLPDTIRFPDGDPRIEVNLGSTLSFGNTFPGSIHGYKFEDINGNGIDDGEPTLPGVTITLTGDVDNDGQIDTVTQTTNANGRYWFENLYPGNYDIAETPPAGSVPTTPPSVSVTLSSNEQIVAFSGLEHPAELEFDLDTSDRFTESGWTSVLPTDTYSPATHFGWGVAVGAFDRGPIADGDPIPDVRRDGHFGMLDRTFSADVINGGYEVTVIMGEAAFPRDFMQVDAEGVTVLSNVSTTAGSWATNSFPVVVTDGQLNLEFSTTAGDPFWVVNGIEIERDYPGTVTIDADLAFGNAFLGSIHGYKFEDLNVDGIDTDIDDDDIGDEPRLAGVEITLTGDVDGDGQTDVVTQRTNADGEYWFENLYPGFYTVSERPPFGTFPTTPVSYTVFVASRQELVALPGQAHLPPVGDPRVEVVIGPDLAFGNAFEGSIHGFKFDDLNGDGIRQPGEPPVAGVAITISWHADGTDFARTTFTDENGEYDFQWLEPGITYTVTELAPGDSEQSSPDPAPITILSGQEYVGTPEQGRQVQLTYTFPWQWDVTIDPVTTPPGQTVTTVLEGHTSIRTSEYLDPVTRAVIAPLADQEGLPLAPRPGEPALVEIEIVALSLRSVEPVNIGGELLDVALLGQPLTQHVGEIQVEHRTDLGPGGDQPGLVGDSFFDVFVELTFTGQEEPFDVGMTVTPAGPEPLRVGMPFDDNNPPPTPPIIPPHDVRWMPTFFWADNIGRDLVDDQGNVWDELVSIHAIPHSELEKPVRPVVDPDLNFGNVYPASIHGTKWEDLNADGIRQANEPGLAGWQIHITGTDGVTGQAISQFVTTMQDDVNTPEDETGMYWIEDLNPGSYIVSEVQQSGWVQSAPASGSYTEIVVSGDELLGRDFGNYRPGALHGRKFHDLNANGQRDDGEPYLNGWTIELVDSSTGEVLATQETHDHDIDNDGGINPETERGWYWFQGLRPDGYSIREVLKSEWRQSAPDGDVWHTTIQSGDVETDLDFGNYLPVSIHGRKFHDRDADGVRDAGEEWLDGWTIELVDPATGAVVATQVTHEADLDGSGGIDPETESGLFWFEDLDPGTYTVREVLQAGWKQSAPAAGSYSFTVTSGDEVFGVRFGNYVPASIHGRKFEDVNANGVRDAGEPWLNGWTIEVVDPATGGVVTTGTTHDADLNGDGSNQPETERGWYWIADLDPGDYIVREVIQPGWAQSAPATNEYMVTLSSQELLQGLNFGNFRPASIHGRKFHDLNANGQRDGGEPWLNNWPIELRDGQGDLVDSASTHNMDLDGNGQIDPETETGWYWLTGIVPGNYTVHEGSVPGWNQSAPGGDGSYSVSVVSGDVLLDRDFGNFQDVSIHARKFEDLNANGRHDEGEPYLDGWTIELRDAQGNLIDTQITHSVDLNGNGTIESATETGWVWFEDFRPGTYSLTEVLQSGWIQSAPGGNGSIPLTLESGDAASARFGNYTRGSIHGRKFEDVDGNGLRDDGEAYLNGWTIELVNVAGEVIATQTTHNHDVNGDGTIDPDTDVGWYWLTDIDPGEYTVREVQQDGWVQTAPDEDVHSITVISGLIFADADFGNRRGGGSIHGRKFHDRDADGVRDDGEEWLNEWTIQLVDDRGAIVGTQQTHSVDLDNDGQINPATETGWYWFRDVNPGDYTVRELHQTGWRQSAPTSGAHSVTVAAQQEIHDLNFGNYRPASLHGRKFHDLNANGERDAGEPFLNGWTIELRDTAGNRIDTQVTHNADLDGDGQINPETETGWYWLEVDPGSYTIGEQLRPGWLQSSPSDPGTHSVTVTSGDEVNGLAFGNFRLASIHGYKFEDLNGNGIDDVEPRLEGVTFTLTGTDANGDQIDPIVEVTGEDGRYWYMDLLPGRYTVTETQPPGSRVSTGSTSKTVVLRSGEHHESLPQHTAPLLIGFETEIVSLELSGGPYPMPLGNDPGNALGDSIDGYGFVDATVTLTLASERPINPGPPSQGQTTAEPVVGQDAPAHPDGAPIIDPQQLDGQDFNVDSFFDVFFDITITDVDGRPGRDFSGQPDGGSFTIVDVGPGTVETTYQATFDKDAPDFGLGQPTSSDPFQGLDNVEIPLGVDINGNGEPDKIKFTNGTFRVGDDNRMAIRLPSGEVIFDFETTGTIDGLVVDESTDPPFSIGGSSPFAGPGTVISEIENPVIPPGFVDDIGLAFGNAFLGSIHGYKFEDLNGNAEDDDEPRLEGVTITLRGDVDGDGDIDSISLTTNDNGEYWFENLWPGAYTVTETPKAGTAPTTPASYDVTVLSRQELVALEGQAHLPDNDRFPDGDPRIEVVIGPELSFGNQKTTGTISGAKYEDLNANGTRDAGEPGLPEWVINLDLDNDGSIDRTDITDHEGNYKFFNVPVGTHQLTEVLLADWDQSEPGPAGSFEHIVNLSGGADVTGRNFGNFVPVRIHGVKYEDLNGNRTRDPNEPGLAGWTIQLTGTDGQGDPVSLTTVTLQDDPNTAVDETGRYSFTTDPGAYVVNEVQQAGWTQSEPASGGYSFPVAESRDQFSGQNFGNLVRGSIHGHKFEDVNANGVDDDDPRLEGVTITLRGDVDGDGQADEITVTTNQQGEYWFENLWPGTYTVSETPPAGSVPTTPHTYQVTVHSRQELVAEDGQAHLPDTDRFPNGDPRDEVNVGPDLAFGNAFLGSIHGYKFFDQNGNSIDDDEPRLPGIAIQLTGDIDGNGTTDTRVERTNERGEYWFEGLRPGTYTVREIVPAGFTVTTPEAYTVTVLSRQELVAEPGQAHLTDPDDPRVEVVIGPELVFGNIFDALKLDFEPASFPTQAGFQRVLRTTAHDPVAGQTFGWLGLPAVHTFASERLPTELRELHRDMIGDDLRQDFRIDVPRGLYTVTLNIAQGNDFRVLDGQTTGVLLDGINVSDRTQPIHRTFPIDTGVNDFMHLQFEGTGLWLINGLTVRPMTPLDINIAGPGGTLAADGSTVSSFNVTGLNAGSTYSIGASLGEVIDVTVGGTTLPDFDGRIAGPQILADASGNASFSLLHPTAAGDSLITVQEATGLHAGELTQPFEQTFNVLQLDFEPASFPTQAGFQRVLKTTLYNPSIGQSFGWLSVPGVHTIASVRNPTLLAELHRDMIGDRNATRTMRIDVPAGTYTVTMSIADAENFQVVDGGTGTTLLSGFHVANRIHPTHVTFPVDTGSNDFMELEMAGVGLWLVNGLTVREETPLDITIASPGPLDADGVTLTDFAVSGLNPGSTYTVSASLGDIANLTVGGMTSTDFDGRLLGQQIVGDASGNATVTIQHPVVGGTSLIAVREATGLHAGELNQVFNLAFDALQFDFEVPGFPTQPGFHSVLRTTAYNPPAGQPFGWTTPPSVHTLTTNVAPTEFAPLTRDMIGDDLAPRTFQVDVPTGNYTVTVSVADGENFEVVDPRTGTPLLAPVNVASRVQPSHFTFPVNTGVFNSIALRMSGSGLWLVNGLTIRDDTPDEITIISPGALEGDGTTISDFGVSGLNPGSTYTVSTTLGEIVGLTVGGTSLSDFDARYLGPQILADASGNATISILHPSSFGDAEIRVDEATGLHFGTLTQTFGLPAAGLSFDFEPASFPTQAGFMRVVKNQVYNPAAGNNFGWLTPAGIHTIASARTPTQFANLTRDMIGDNGVPRTFRVDVPAGTYSVTVIVADGEDFQVVDPASGTVLLSGLDVATRLHPTHRTFGFNTGVNEFIELEMSGIGVWLVNGLTIRNDTPLDITIATPGPLPADGLTVTDFAVTGLNPGSTYSVTASLGSISSLTVGATTQTDFDGRFLGPQILADASGNATISLQHPVTAGTSMISVQEATGLHAGELDQVFGGPLMASSVGDGGATLAPATLNGVVNTALSLFAAAGLSTDEMNRLSNVQFEITDLGGATLGLAGGNVVYIDVDGAGHGWSVETPDAHDPEPVPGSGVDLLSTVLHELGHILGLSHDGELSNVMNSVLDPGTHHALDHVFADREILEAMD